MDRIPIIYVQGEEALAEGLRFVVHLDPQSLSCVERSETFLQFAQDIFVHGITSSKIGSIFYWSIGLCQTLQSIPFGQTACFRYRCPDRSCCSQWQLFS